MRVLWVAVRVQNHHLSNSVVSLGVQVFQSSSAVLAREISGRHGDEMLTPHGGLHDDIRPEHVRSVYHDGQAFPFTIMHDCQDSYLCVHPECI